MKLIANRQLTGGYGTVQTGHPFDVDDLTGRDLVKRGLARPFEVARITYQTKVVTPEAPQIVAEAPEVSARQPFRDGALHNTQPEELATEGDSVLSGADLQVQGNADSIGRRGRGRFDPRR